MKIIPLMQILKSPVNLGGVGREKVFYTPHEEPNSSKINEIQVQSPYINVDGDGCRIG